MGRGGLRYSEGSMNLRNLRNERKKSDNLLLNVQAEPFTKAMFPSYMRKLFAYYM